MTGRYTILSTKTLRPDVLAYAEKREADMIISDFIQIEYTISSDDVSAILTATEPLILTSQHGVKALEKVFSEALVPEKSRIVYCISGETKKAAEKLRQLDIAGSAADGKSLAEIIIDQNKSTNFQYICSSIRRDELPNLLKTAGKIVKEFPLYQTRLTGTKITRPYHAVLFFSPSGADSFFQANILPAGIPCFSIGETTATAVSGHGGKVAGIADEPDQRKLVEKAITYLKKSGKKQRL